MAIEIIDEKSTKESVAKSNPTEPYVLRFKKGSGAVVTIYFQANDDDDAKKRSLAFCRKHQFRHVYTKRFFSDLETWDTIY
jgi:hypothetical protein